MPLPSRSDAAFPRLRRPPWMRALPAAILVAALLVELLTPTWIPLGVVIIAVPPLSALVNPPWLTAAVSLVGWGAFSALFRAEDEVTGSVIEPHNVPTVVLVVLLSVVMSWVRERAESRLVRVSTVAEAAQRAVLPDLPERVGPLRCATSYRSADRDARVGGDLYDVRETPSGARAVVGDVKGHGVSVIGTVAALLGTFRESALDQTDLTALGGRLERRMGIENDGRGEWDGVFVTALLMEYRPREAVMRLVSYGHPAPLLLSSGRVVEVEVLPNPPLGLAGTLSSYGAPVDVPFAPGDVLLAFTDGAVEARDRRGAFYPLARRVAEHVGAGRPVTPGTVVDFVRVDLERFARELTDDVALVAIGV